MHEKPLFQKKVGEHVERPHIKRKTIMQGILAAGAALGLWQSSHDVSEQEHAVTEVRDDVDDENSAAQLHEQVSGHENTREHSSHLILPGRLPELRGQIATIADTARDLIHKPLPESDWQQSPHAPEIAQARAHEGETALLLQNIPFMGFFVKLLERDAPNVRVVSMNDERGQHFFVMPAAGKDFSELVRAGFAAFQNFSLEVLPQEDGIILKGGTEFVDSEVLGAEYAAAEVQRYLLAAALLEQWQHAEQMRAETLEQYLQRLGQGGLVPLFQPAALADLNDKKRKEKESGVQVANK